MTVDELIRELEKLPKHIEVLVHVREVWVSGGCFIQDPQDASPADDVRYEGSFVRIEGR